MKNLTKLALVSAMAMSGSAFALQSLDDADLSAATGQDGISIIVAGGIDADVVIHDKDGYQSLAAGGVAGPTATPTRTALAFGAAGTDNVDAAGAIFLDNFFIHDTSATPTGIRIHVDADGNAANGPVLNVNIGLPQSLTINTGTVYVSKSTRNSGHAANLTNFGNHTSDTKVLDPIEIVLSNASLNLQLGNATQGAMIKLGGVLTGGLTINNLSIYQPKGVAGLGYTAASTGGTLVQTDASGNVLTGIHIAQVNVTSAGAANLDLTTTNPVTVNAVNAGLAVDVGGALDVKLRNVSLGNKTTAGSIGDVALLGLTVPKLIISGH